MSVQVSRSISHRQMLTEYSVVYNTYLRVLRGSMRPRLARRREVVSSDS